MSSERNYKGEEFIKLFASEETNSENGEIVDNKASASQSSSYKANIMSAGELLKIQFPEPKYAVEGILPEGLTVFVGKPKSGKTWCALGIAIAVASGGRALGQIPVEEGDVLCLGLEDGARRLQNRLKILLNGNHPRRLDIATTWRRLDEGGLDDIEGWLDDHPEARLVIVDTLKRVRPPERHGGRLYDGDYDSVSGLGDLAKQYGVAVVVIHHTRKLVSDDPLEMVSGSNGLTGATDGVLVLKRSRGETDAELFATGRDFEEKSLALKWDNEMCQWVIVGDAEEYRLSQERREIVDLLRRSGTSMMPKEIAQALNRKEGSVRKMLFDMTRDEQVKNNGKGQYSLPSKFSNNGNGGNSNTKGNKALTLFDSENEVTGVTDVTELHNEDDEQINYRDMPF